VPHQGYIQRCREALAYTLEDAIVAANLELFTTLAGNGLIAKFRAAIADSADFAALSAAMKEALKGGNKAEFALDLLEIETPTNLKPPRYIREGLLWLAQQLAHNQAELGLASLQAAPAAPAITPEAPAGEAAA
jgi:hypothetical protein